MNFNINHAFSFLFGQRLWFLKLFMCVFLLLVPTLFDLALLVVSPNKYLITYLQTFISAFEFIIIPIFLIFLVGFFTVAGILCLFGYIFQTMHNQIHHKEPLLQGFWGHTIGYVWSGFKAISALWIWVFILGSAFVFAFLMFCSSKLLPSYVKYFTLSNFSNHPYLIPKLLVILAILAVLYFIFIIPAGLVAFAKDLKFGSFFNLVEIHRIINKATGSYILAYIAIIVLKAINSSLVFLLSLDKYTIIIVPFVFVYFMLVSTNILAQLDEE